MTDDLADRRRVPRRARAARSSGARRREHAHDRGARRHRSRARAARRRRDDRRRDRATRARVATCSTRPRPAVYLPPGSSIEIDGSRPNRARARGDRRRRPARDRPTPTPQIVDAERRRRARARDGRVGSARCTTCRRLGARAAPARRRDVQRGRQWSSFPPHKHDGGDGEPALEEVYYYRFDRPDGFGFQGLYERRGDERRGVPPPRRGRRHPARLPPGVRRARLPPLLPLGAERGGRRHRARSRCTRTRRTAGCTTPGSRFAAQAEAAGRFRETRRLASERCIFDSVISVWSSRSLLVAAHAAGRRIAEIGIAQSTGPTSSRRRRTPRTSRRSRRSAARPTGGRRAAALQDRPVRRSSPARTTSRTAAPARSSRRKTAGSSASAPTSSTRTARRRASTSSTCTTRCG